jgi:GT2 family glycosyltransferase
MIAGKKLFVSVLTYDLHRRLGDAAGAAFLEQVHAPTRQSLPCARTVARLASMAELQLYHGASSCLPKARSRAAHAAWKSGADFWIMCDDDVEAPTATIADLIAIAGRPSSARIAVLPCLLRGERDSEQKLNCVFGGPARLNVEAAAWVRPVKLAGCGLVVVTRMALELLGTFYAASMAYDDDDGVQRVALFDMLIDGKQWLGEDFAFCRRAELAGVPIDGLVQGISNHAGKGLELDSVRDLVGR